MKYTLLELNEIIGSQGWSFCVCNNEKDGEDCEGVDTIQVSQFEDGEYFGEFVGEASSDLYEFKFYKI